MRALLACLLGGLWRRLRLPPPQDQPENDEPPAQPMFPSQMRDDPNEKRGAK